MHRGCFAWRPTPPLSGRRTPRPGPVRVCVCVSLLAGSGGLASRARCGAPHLFLWPVLLRSLFAPPPPGWGRAFFLSFGAPRLSPAFLVFGPGLPALGVLPPRPFSFLRTPFLFSLCAPVVSCVPCFPAQGALCLGVFLSPPPSPFFFLGFPCAFCSSSPNFFFAFFSLCALVVSCVPCFPARSALGLGVFLSPPPPPFSFFFPRSFFSSSPGFFFAPPLSLAFRVFRPGTPWALAPCCRPRPPPLLFFPSCLIFAFCFFFSSSVPCWWCGAGLACVSWALGCAGVYFGGAVPVVALCVVLSRPSGAGPCCVVLPVGFGCLLFGLAVLCCLLLGPGVGFGGAVPVWPRGSPPRGLVWCVLVFRCPVLCFVALSCRSVVCCRALLIVCVLALCLLFVSCRWASVVCVPGSRAVCSLSSAPCAVLCCAVLVPLCCAVCVFCAVSDAWCCWFLVSLCVFGGLLVFLVAWCCCLVVCVGLGVRVWPRLLSLGVFPAVSYSPGLCLVALCCRVVLCCGALSSLLPFSFCLACVAGCLFPLNDFL